MAEPRRQRSFKDRLHGIGISWQSKKSDSYPGQAPASQCIEISSSQTESYGGSLFSSSAPMSSLSPNLSEPRNRSSTDISPTEASSSDKKALSRSLTQPQGTIEYAVSSSDTLPAIAARFETTPSELTKLNRLTSRLIFPGQILYVPKKIAGERKALVTPPNSPIDKTSTESLEQSSPKPGHAKRIHFDSSGASEESHSTPPVSPAYQLTPYAPAQPIVKTKMDPADRECLERFLKISARHITDGQGVVSGVLLVTPNALMFDPNVSDPLVIEHGTELYGVTVPMEMVLKTAMYSDIAHMRVKHAPEAVPSIPRPEVYYAPEGGEPPSSSYPIVEEIRIPVHQSAKSLSVRASESETEVSETHSNDVFEDSEEKEKADDEKVEGTQESEGTAEETKSESQEDAALSEENARKIALGMRYSVPESMHHSKREPICANLMTANSTEDTATFEKRRSAQGESRREQMLKRLSYPVESISNYTKSGINKVLATPKNIVEFSSGLVRDAKDVFTTSSSKSDSLEGDLDVKGTTIVGNNRNSNSDNRNIGYQNMVDTQIDVFANFEKLIPRPARSCEDPPLYLCLRMGRPANKKLQKYSPAIISFGKKKIEREYWFSIPKEKADNLYHFFHRWAPEIYGDVDDLSGCEERGLVEIATDDEDEEDETMDGTQGETEGGEGKSEDAASEKSTRPKFWRRRGPLNFLKMVEGHFTTDGVGNEWEVVTTQETQRLMTEIAELPLPELVGTSEVLTEDYRKKLCKHLPARAEGYPWTLIYSSSKHGFSLKTLYREMLKYETPVLLVIQDTTGLIFGALTSCSLRLSDHFYGTGETFLFTFHPEFECFPWTGENLYFIKGNPDSVAIGAGDGNFGLWLDGDLFHGRSHPCKTFGNGMLTTQEDFVVKALECWGFV